MIATVAKAVILWLMLVLLAIGNGLVREQLLAPALGPAAALPLSGVSLAALILLAAYVFVPWFGRRRTLAWLAIGAGWLALTLVFEFGFGHYVLGRTWGEIRQVFDVAAGNLFVLALLVTLLAPWLAARWRGLVGPP